MSSPHQILTHLLSCQSSSTCISECGTPSWACLVVVISIVSPRNLMVNIGPVIAEILLFLLLLLLLFLIKKPSFIVWSNSGHWCYSCCCCCCFCCCHYWYCYYCCFCYYCCSHKPNLDQKRVCNCSAIVVVVYLLFLLFLLLMLLLIHKSSFNPIHGGVSIWHDVFRYFSHF